MPQFINESHGRSHASLHCTTFRRPAYQMVNWQLNKDVVQVRLDAGPPHLMRKDPQMPRWHGCQKAAMGRTVVSLITLAHLFSIGVACKF